jgi:hypothetical protein
MTVRQEIGIAASAIGILINVVHFALFFFSATPEKYHDHIGFVLTIGGLLLLLDKKQER